MQQDTKRNEINKMLQRRLWTAAVLTGLVLPATGEEEHGHFDISPTTADGKIISNSYSDLESAFLPGERVFGYEIGEGTTGINDSLGGFVGDPGINAILAQGWGSGDGNPGLRIIGPLTIWVDQTTGYVPVADSAVFLRLNFGPSSISSSNRDVYGSTGTLADLFLTSTHAHYNVTINDTSGDRLDATTDPAVGVYQVEAQIVSTNTSLQASDPIFLNFNYWADEAIHEAALEYTQSILVPEPGSAVALLLGAGLIASRRRRK